MTLPSKNRLLYDIDNIKEMKMYGFIFFKYSNLIYLLYL
jgi:hypothetical protein